MLDFGFLLLDKPAGITSFQVIARLRKITGIKKIGHTGTLDPFATGLLPVCIGKATRLASFLSEDKKSYLAEIALGSKTNTGDVTGEVTESAPVIDFSPDEIQQACRKMLALKQQTPPAYSALKIAGQKACDLARKGESVILAPRDITIYDFKIISNNPPQIRYEATVSKGTYIRTLSETFAAALSNLAHTTSLRRLTIGNLNLSQAVKLETISQDNWKNFLLSPTEILPLPQLQISNSQIDDFCQGRIINLQAHPQENCLVISADHLALGIATISPEGWLKPRIVLTER